ncbi:MAG: PadR family transcriptional regulator [Cytophagales bacterium]|nr:MAG: PadR family transcriptional regulator [Cytophagales bacterium]
MNIENAQVQMRKGILEFCILHIISRGEVYASDMLDELTSARIMVVEGTLYPLLTRLKNAGLLDYKWVESTSGPPRKYYLLTELGRVSLEALNETWVDLSDSVHSIVEKTEQVTKPQNGSGVLVSLKPIEPIPMPSPSSKNPS